MLCVCAADNKHAVVRWWWWWWCGGNFRAGDLRKTPPYIYSTRLIKLIAFNCTCICATLLYVYMYVWLRQGVASVLLPVVKW